jgi:hypothetical protein
MSGTVTVPGITAPITLAFTGSLNISLADQIAAALNAASAAGTLTKVDYTTGATVPPAPSGNIEELVLSPTVSGSITVPAAASGVTEVLVVQNSQPITIHGNANLSIIGGNANVTIIDPTVFDYADNGLTTNTDAVTVTAADSPYIVAMRTGSETVVGLGSGTISGGLGANFINVSGADAASSNLILSQGFHDVIQTGVGNATVDSSGTRASIEGGAGNLTINDTGLQDSVFAATAATLNVTTNGSQALITGGSGTLTDTDTGFHDTILAGGGAATALMSGVNSEVKGSTGSLSVNDVGIGNVIVGGTTGATTVTIAGAGATVYGRTGNMTILDKAPGAFIGTGSGVGNVTIGGADASVFGGTSGTLNISIGAANAFIGTGGTAATVDASSGAATGAAVFGGYSSIQAQDGPLVVNGGANPLLVGTGASNATVNAGSGSTGVYIGNGTIAGSNVVHGGSGFLTVQFLGGAGSATVFGGSGTTSLFGTAGTFGNFQGTSGTGFLYANGSNSSSETLSAAGSTTNDTLFAAHGNVSLIAGSGNDELIGGLNTGSQGGAGSVVGGSTLQGSSGHDLFDFVKGLSSGADVVTNFTASDTVFLAGYDTLAGGAAGSNTQGNLALANATVTGGNTTIGLADGTKITFVGTTTAQLTGHLFSS